MIIATCGHVDHGKTLLVHGITGIQTDRLQTERERGLTIDLGFAYFDLGKHRIGFIDVPGHIRFIDNMLAGVSVIDHGLLVIAADDGPMPQTREHIAILELLQIPRITIALTKIDRVDPARIEQVRQEIATVLAATPYAESQIFPVSGVTRAGMPDLVDHLSDLARDVSPRQAEGYFRLAIDRAFNIKGTGVVVTGSVFSGKVNVGDEMRLMPADLPVRIRGIHRQDQPAESGMAGDRCALNLAAPGLRKDAIHRGNWITANPAGAIRRADAVIRILGDETKPLRHWTPVHVHTAANHVTGRIATLEDDHIEPGAGGLVQLVLASPINLCRGDRFIIRDQAATNTIGGGTIVDPFSPARGRTHPARIAELKALLLDDPCQRLDKYLQLHAYGISGATYKLAENLTEEQWRDLRKSVGAVEAGDDLITSQHHKNLADRLLERLGDWHKSHREAPGATRGQLRQLMPGALSDPLLDSVISQLARDRRISIKGNTFAVPEHTMRLEGDDLALWQKIEPLLAESPTRPPVMHDIAKSLRLSPDRVEKLLVRCAQLGYVIRPATNRFFLPAGITTLRQLVDRAATAAPDGMFSVQEFRDLAGIGRNLCIEVLEYFDRHRITVRTGDKRRLAGPLPTSGR